MRRDFAWQGMIVLQSATNDSLLHGATALRDKGNEQKLLVRRDGQPFFLKHCMLRGWRRGRRVPKPVSHGGNDGTIRDERSGVNDERGHCPFNGNGWIFEGKDRYVSRLEEGAICQYGKFLIDPYR